MKKFLSFLAVILAISGMFFIRIGNAGELKIKANIEIQAEPFDLADVKLLESPFLTAQQADLKYLLQIDVDRMLHNFRINAGLPSSAQPYGGWEKPDCEVRGHTAGHYVSGCALMYAAAGDKELKNRVDKMVEGFAACQKALGDKGYLSAFPESFFDRVEAIKPVWAPYYTIHKILNGMVDAYLYCDNQQALEVARKMAAWVKFRCDKLSRSQMQTMLSNTEQGGMNDGLVRLFKITGDLEHYQLARRFDEDTYTQPLAKKEDHLKGQHVNSFIPNMIGTANEYEISNDTFDHTIASYFWDQVTGHRCYATGGMSNYEAWRTDPDVLANELSNTTQETCCEYNMLKLTRHLFGWNPDAKYMDYYERTLYNCILPTIEPKNGMTMYYVPLNSGKFKVFNTPDNSFWCCTGTGWENHAKYGDTIYFHHQNTLYVNLFIPSELQWSEQGATVRMDTQFPQEDKVKLTIHLKESKNLDIKIRIPSWITGRAEIAINGEKQQNKAEPASYISLKKDYKDGDVIELRLPMNLWLQTMPDDKNLAAVMYGPVVLAGELGKEKLKEDMQYLIDPSDQNNAPAIEVPRLSITDRDPNQWLKRVTGDSFTFKFGKVEQPSNLTFVPFYGLFGQRYAIYWPIRSQEEWATIDHKEILTARQKEFELKAYQKYLIDEVHIGEATSETRHNMQSSNSRNGFHAGHNWRDANDGGWFSYDLQVKPDKLMMVLCSYWGGDNGRNFNILVDNQFIFKESLHQNAPGELIHRVYIIPLELTDGKEKVTVKFQAREGGFAGGVFGCASIKNDE